MELPIWLDGCQVDAQDVGLWVFVGYSWSGRAVSTGCWAEHTIVDCPYACPAANIKGPTDALERGEARLSIEGEPHDMVLEV